MALFTVGGGSYVGDVDTYVGDADVFTDPTSIDGCELWLDASDGASITSSGGAVSQWSDKSGLANHATQSTAGLKPTTGANTLNGLNVLRFNIDTLMLASAITDAQTIFMVVRKDYGIWSQRFVLGDTVGGDSYLYLSDHPTNPGPVNYRRAWPGPDVASGNYNQGDWILVRVTDTLGTTSAVTVAIDGTAGTPGNHTANPGRIDAIGYNASDVEKLVGDIAEIVVYDSVLTAGDIADVENYLTEKWLPTSDTVAGSLATETDTGRSGAPVVVVQGQRATETDTGNTGAVGFGWIGQQATESDTGRTGSVAAVAVGQRATEVDTANTGTVIVAWMGSRATETDDARPGAPSVAMQGALATETDTANAGRPYEYGVWVPDADVSNDGWTNELDSSVNLWASIDDLFVADDSDYVQSPPGTQATVRFSTADIPAPASAGRTLRVRYQAVGTGTGTLYVRVRDGVTLVAERSWSVDGGDTWVDRNVELTPAEVANISDPDNLDLELEAVPV